MSRDSAKVFPVVNDNNSSISTDTDNWSRSSISDSPTFTSNSRETGNPFDLAPSSPPVATPQRAFTLPEFNCSSAIQPRSSSIGEFLLGFHECADESLRYLAESGRIEPEVLRALTDSLRHHVVDHVVTSLRFHDDGAPQSANIDEVLRPPPELQSQTIPSYYHLYSDRTSCQVNISSPSNCVDSRRLPLKDNESRTVDLTSSSISFPYPPLFASRIHVDLENVDSSDDDDDASMDDSAIDVQFSDDAFDVLPDSRLPCRYSGLPSTTEIHHDVDDGSSDDDVEMVTRCAVQLTQLAERDDRIGKVLTELFQLMDEEDSESDNDTCYCDSDTDTESVL